MKLLIAMFKAFIGIVVLCCALVLFYLGYLNPTIGISGALFMLFILFTIGHYYDN